MTRLAALVITVTTVISFGACSDDSGGDIDAAVDATDAAVDAIDAGGPCPGEMRFTGGYLEWDSTGGIPGINASTWTVRGQPTRTDMSAPNGRIDMCLQPTGASTIDVTEASHVAAVYV